MQTKLQPKPRAAIILRLLAFLLLAIAMSDAARDLPATETKRAFLSDFLATDNPNPLTHNWNINRYYTLLIECWPRAAVKNLIASNHRIFFRHLELKNNDELKTAPDKFNNYEIIDFDCPQSWDVLSTQVWDDHNPPVRWMGFFKQILILVDADNFAELGRVLMNPNGRIKVSVMSRVIIARRIHSERYQLYQVYRISKDRPLVYEDFGYWSINEGLILTKQKGEITTRRRNLQGLFFVISCTLENPETINYYNTTKHPQTDTVIKQSYAMFSNLVDIVNMTYANVFHNTFGYYNSTSKKWNGHTESLRIGTSNYSASPLVVIRERVPFIDFVIQISQKITVKFIFKSPPTSYVKDIFNIAFHCNVWYALLGMSLLYCIFIGYLLNIEKKVFNNYTANANDGFLITLESITQQGSVVTTKSISGEILIVILSLACMFFYTAYSTNIVSLLQSTTSIKTVKELLDSPFEVGAEDTIYIKYFMRIDTDPVRKALYDTKVTEHGFLKKKEGLDRVRQGGYAFHIDKNPAYYYILRYFDITEVCSLQRIEALYLPTHLIYIPMIKASPYKKIKKVGAFRILETGLHQRHVLLFEQEPKCSGIAPTFKMIELVDVETAFVIFLSGVCLTMWVLAMEIVYHRKIALKAKIYKGKKVIPSA